MHRWCVDIPTETSHPSYCFKTLPWRIHLFLGPHLWQIITVIPILKRKEQWAVYNLALTVYNWALALLKNVTLWDADTSERNAQRKLLQYALWPIWRWKLPQEEAPQTGKHIQSDIIPTRSESHSQKKEYLCVTMVTRGHLSKCLNCIFSQNKLYFNIEMHLRWEDACHVGRLF